MTTKFDRRLNTDHLSAKTLETYPLLAQLLGRWVPSGHDSGGDHGLRMAIRSKELHFYSHGQRVCAVGFPEVSQGEISFLTDRAYCGDPDGSRRSGDYALIDGRRNYPELDEWHRAAINHPHKSYEKVFVDALSAANPGIIDVEAAIPGFPNGRKKKDGSPILVSPRMDMVGLEAVDGKYYLVFWEAKTSKNKEAKRREGLPSVVAQIQKYEAWLKDVDQRERLVASYTEYCQLLVQLHELARRVNPNIRPLGSGIVAIGSRSAKIFDVDPLVRVVIDDTGLHGAPEQPSFVKNGHDKKLISAGIPLCLVSKGGSFRLEVVKCL